VERLFVPINMPFLFDTCIGGKAIFPFPSEIYFSLLYFKTVKMTFTETLELSDAGFTAARCQLNVFILTY